MWRNQDFHQLRMIRRMKCDFLFILAISNCLCYASEVHENIGPLCLINYGHLEEPCANFMERPLEKLAEESWTEQAVRVTQSAEYFNLSLVYTRKMEISPIFVMIRYGQFPLPEKTWEIQPISRHQPDGPLLLAIAFAPKVSNHTRYQLRRIVNPGKLFEDPECNRSESLLDCKHLKNSKLFMRKSLGNILSLTISREGPRRTLAVEVLSAPCNITCRGEINACSGIEIKNLRWDESMDELKIYNASNSSAPTYYCARIALAYHECCMIYTETKILNPDPARNISITFSQRIYLPECVIVLTISVSLLISAVFTIKKLFGKNTYKCWPYYSLSSQEDGLLNSLQDDTSPSKASTDSPQPVPQLPVEILLIYPKGSDPDGKIMEKFRYILSFYATKVWDPFDELEMEKVSENPTMWLESILNKEHAKVILVENSSTVEWYETLLNGRPAVYHHHLDSLFLYTVSVLHNNPYLCHNYRRLFIIRFSSSKIPTKVTNIVPCTRYEIPANIGSLIKDLVGSYTEDASADFKPPLKEIKELEMMVKGE